MKGLVTVAIVIALCSASVSHAQDEQVDKKQKAAQLAREATGHFRLNEFDGALKAYAEAYRAFPEPSLLYNIAQCHRQLDHKQDAVRFFKSYLNEVPTAENKDEVERFIQKLEAALKEENAARNMPPQGPITTSPPSAKPSPPAAPALGRLRVTSTPGGASVRFDDNDKSRVGTTPAEFGDLVPGNRRLFVSKDGCETIKRNVDIVPGETLVVDLQLTAADAAAPQPAAEESRSHTPVYKKWWLWAAVGAAAAVGLGVGLGVGLAPGPSAPSATTTTGTFHF